MLLGWYERVRRDLPWRRTRDPWLILLSEVMLQQTRVAAALPYYERFAARFPTAESLAAAPDAEVLALWSGLGYYARARNLRRAAAEIAARGAFPETYEEILSLPGIGEYTAAAVGSIAFGLPHAVLDGNVIRVVSRLTAERGDVAQASTRARLRERAQRLLDTRQPGEFNQALMELGATVCLPQTPQCLLCPLRDHCVARRLGSENELPIKLRKRDALKVELKVLLVEKDGKLLLRQRHPGSARLSGFWELPEARDLSPEAGVERLGSFRHSITRHDYTVEVWRGVVSRAPKGFRWVAMGDLSGLPLATTVRKALRVAGKGLERAG